MNINPNPAQLAAMHEAARRLVLFTMAGEHLRGGDGFVPVSDLQAISDLARGALTDHELGYLAAEAAEYNEDSIHFEPPEDLSVRVVRAADGNYRWMLLRAVADGGYAEHAHGDSRYLDYADAFGAGTAALVAEGRQRGTRAFEAANDRQMGLLAGAA